MVETIISYFTERRIQGEGLWPVGSRWDLSHSADGTKGGSGNLGNPVAYHKKRSVGNVYFFVSPKNTKENLQDA